MTVLSITPPGVQHTIWSTPRYPGLVNAEERIEARETGDAPCDDEVTCLALELALVTTNLHRAWHAGVIDADQAMRGIDRVVTAIGKVRAESVSRLQTAQG
jgi:hypothetical protein